jgi:hypothetical protein
MDPWKSKTPLAASAAMATRSLLDFDVAWKRFRVRQAEDSFDPAGFGLSDRRADLDAATTRRSTHVARVGLLA